MKTSNRTCARCQAPMHCGAASADDNCWCEELPPLKEIAAEKSCFCRPCLEAALAKERA